mmetsp:Transcript_37982/g.94377  ORF Transcript_37982/g.94377 Transcript_37982/m.94377 type:complete len:301 (-) Transcript_37982:705-1607(-)
MAKEDVVLAAISALHTLCSDLEGGAAAVSKSHEASLLAACDRTIELLLQPPKSPLTPSKLTARMREVQAMSLMGSAAGEHGTGSSTPLGDLSRSVSPLDVRAVGEAIQSPEFALRRTAQLSSLELPPPPTLIQSRFHTTPELSGFSAGNLTDSSSGSPRSRKTSPAPVRIRRAASAGRIRNRAAFNPGPEAVDPDLVPRDVMEALARSREGVAASPRAAAMDHLDDSHTPGGGSEPARPRRVKSSASVSRLRQHQQMAMLYDQQQQSPESPLSPDGSFSSATSSLSFSLNPKLPLPNAGR